MQIKQNLLSLAALAALVICGCKPAGAEQKHVYLGSKKCKICHMKQYKSWAETKMANSFELLQPGVGAEAKRKAGFDPDKDYTTDASCVACHCTGHGLSGGFVDLESTPDLAGVGCEACHGAAGTYTQKQYMSLSNKNYKKSELVAAGLVGKIGKAQCTPCHNTKNPFVGEDYLFDFEERVTQGTHESFPLKYKH